MVGDQTKWYTDKMVLDKMVYGQSSMDKVVWTKWYSTKWYGENGMDKVVFDKMVRTT